jgi:hypothetical protein
MNKEDLYTRYPLVPHQTVNTIVDYVERKLRPGGFIMSCLENKFTDAAMQADTSNLAAIKEIAFILHWEVPATLWGTKTQVKDHLKS